MPHPDRSLYFWHYNTGKRSVRLDVDGPEGASQLRALLATADVFIETLPPGRAVALGLDYETLGVSNQRLIHVAITPFGQTGPHVDAGYRTTDLVSMALGGPMSPAATTPRTALICRRCAPATTTAITPLRTTPASPRSLR